MESPSIEGQLWSLVLSVNLTELRDSPIAGKALFLGVSVRVFLEEIGIQISRLNKIPLTEAGGQHPTHWRPEWNTKGGWRASSLCQLELRHPSSPALDAGTQAFRVRMNYTTKFPGSLACRQHIRNFSASIIAWTNSYDIYFSSQFLWYLYIYLSILLVLFLCCCCC